MKKYKLLALAGVLGALGYGVYVAVLTPTAAILGPSVAQTGDLVVLAANESEADHYTWTVVPPITQQRTMEGGKLLVLAPDTPGDFVVVLATGGGKGGVAMATHALTVDGQGPPAPTPTPAPEPEPDGADWTQWTEKTVVATVASPGRASQAAALAGQLRSVAAKIAAGAIQTPKEARQELRAANVRALGSGAAAWSGFSVRFAEHCAELAASGDLKTLKQYQTIYVAVATGLDKVAAAGSPRVDRQPRCTGGQCRW